MSAQREALVARIALQRTELAAAYHALEKPIHYAEMGLRGFGFLKRYPWIAIAAPSALSMLFSTLSFVLHKGRPARDKIDDEQKRELHRLVEQAEERRRKPLARWVGYAFQAFRTYRKLRTFIPFLP
jgi:hypothetical protein